MVNIIKKKLKSGNTGYYIYDNKYDSVTKKYKKVYLGVADENDYNEYLIEQDRKHNNPNYCKKCGGRVAITLPPYFKEKN